MAITDNESCFIAICLEGFFFGLYSGIFALYLQCPSDTGKPRPIVVFYFLCLLYVLSTATIVFDLLTLVLDLRISTLSLQLQIDSQPMLFRLSILQTIASGCCDFIAQCIMIYRCWITWGQNINVVIVPSFLAIVYLASWLASTGSTTIVQDQYVSAAWEFPVVETGFAASMAVNTLVTGLIVFRILRVKVHLTSVERTLGSTRGTSLRDVVFIIIESGMTLFAIQLVRVVLSHLPAQSVLPNAVDLAIGINEMFNGIAPTIILVRVSMRLSFHDKESFMEAVESLCFNSPPSDPPEDDEPEDMRLNNPPSDTNALQQIESSSSMPPEERSELEDRILEIA